MWPQRLLPRFQQLLEVRENLQRVNRRLAIRRVLRKNRALNGIHAGRRCFLVGNGPSLGQQDLAPLGGEVAVVASSFFRHPQAAAVNPKYWVFADPLFWQKPDIHFVPAFNAAREKNASTRLFVPTGGLEYFSSLDMGPRIQTHYYDYKDAKEAPKSIDFGKRIPRFGQNTMNITLMLAMYLGCNPIYFIGCDRDYWNMSREAFEASACRHFYEDPVPKPFHEQISWNSWLQARDRTEWEVEQLKQYANARGIRIYNATAGGQFEQFPRVQYEALFR